MEIRRWHYYVIFNCVIIKLTGTDLERPVKEGASVCVLEYRQIAPKIYLCTDLEAKTISLNEVITAESQHKEAFETTLPPKSAASTGKRYSLIKRLTSASRVKNFLESGFLLDHTPLGGNKISSIKYKKAYLIKSPLKPRKLKLIQKSRYKRKNQSAKREINGNETLKQKYIPLLKSLSMLFDNLLNSDASESYEVKTKKFKRNRFYSEETFEVPCNYTLSNSGVSESKSQEEAVTFSPTPTTETSTIAEDFTTTVATTTTANITTSRDFSPFRQNKNIPVLLPRSTFSGRGDHNGIGERSGATLHGNIEGNITRHHGDHGHVAGCGNNESCTEDNEKYTNGITRDSARGFRLPRPTGVRNNTGFFPRGNRTDTENNPKIETTEDCIRKNQFKTGRDETKGGRVLQESIRRLRGFTSEDVKENTESVQPKEVHEEGVFNITHNNAGYQRITDKGSTFATDDQKVRKGNETITLVNSTNSITSHSIASKKKSPVVMIFEGYSMSRHNNKTGQARVGLAHRGVRTYL